MIWILLLCHFIADYPLQTDAIARGKKHVRGLIVHVAIHFITLLVIMVGVLRMDLSLVLPAILALTGLHFAIDTWKNILSNLRPGWVIFTYLQDQVLHVISILVVVSWVGFGTDIPRSSWIIPALSLVWVTHVWFVTERLVTYKSPEYQQWVNGQSWPRMTGRALILSAWFIGSNLWALLVLVVGLFHHWIDLAGPFHSRALLIDISVVLCVVAGLTLIY